TFNNTIVQKRVGGNFTGLKLKPKKLEVLAFTYEINVVGTSVWSLSKIYKVIGSIKYDLASFLNLDLKGSSKYKVEEKLDINGSKEFTLEALFPINGNKKFKAEIIKSILGISKHHYFNIKELIGKTDFELLRDVNGKLKVSFASYKKICFGNKKILESLIELRDIKGNKKFKYEMNKDIVGKRDIISMLISSDIFNRGETWIKLHNF
ncbi:hypothetical protein LCGC14_2489560, partial [marine sediment metagenome]